MKHGSIPSQWLTVLGTFDAQKLLALLEEVDKRKINHNDFTSVVAVWEELNAKPKLPATQRAVIYLHGSKEANHDQGEALGLEGEALNNFMYSCYEVKIEGDVNTATGEFAITHVDGREIITESFTEPQGPNRSHGTGK